jgi:tetratricopeptide (TPR) repeat protein
MSDSPAGVLRALKDIARTLRSRIEDLDPTELAYAQLWRGEELEPWSGPAQDSWERQSRDTVDDDTDVGVVHHLAVLHHARAYDLESTAGVEVALPHWDKALGHWAWLYRNDGFWAAMARHLAEVTSQDVPAAVVAEVRERLPADLLAVHTSLAIEHRLRDPDTARAHMALVERSAFPPEAIAAARHGLTADLDNRVAQAVQRSRFGAAFDDVAAWLRVDPTNRSFLRNLLYVSNNWAEFLNKQKRWTAAMGGLLDEVDALLNPALSLLGDELGALATELARHEFWRGFCRTVTVGTTPPDATADRLQADLRSLSSATGHFRRALELDPTLALVGYYNANRELAVVLTRMAELAVRLEPDSREIEEHLREALERQPDHQRAQDLLDGLSQGGGAAGGGNPVAVESVRDEIQRGELDTAVAHVEVLVRRAQNLGECADIEPLLLMIRSHVLDSVRLLRRLEDAMNELRRKNKKFQDSPWAEGR